MNYRELLEADRRLVILKALAEDPGYSHNESVLQSVLDLFGHRVSRDQVRTLLSWLAEQGLVELDRVSSCLVARLSARGGEVAAGRTVVPGVKRPAPGN